MLRWPARMPRDLFNYIAGTMENRFSEAKSPARYWCIPNQSGFGADSLAITALSNSSEQYRHCHPWPWPGCPMNWNYASPDGMAIDVWAPFKTTMDLSLLRQCALQFQPLEIIFPTAHQSLNSPGVRCQNAVGGKFAFRDCQPEYSRHQRPARKALFHDWAG